MKKMSDDCHEARISGSAHQHPITTTTTTMINNQHQKSTMLTCAHNNNNNNSASEYKHMIKTSTPLMPTKKNIIFGTSSAVEASSPQTNKQIKDLNDLISCYLCKGYLIDATTIIECLHSFCKTCILKYFNDDDNPKSRFCPKCDTQVHKTKPKLNIRSDPTLQDMVYKLVPGLFKNEMSRRKRFYLLHPEKAVGLSNEEKGEINGERLILSNDDFIQITIEYFPKISNPFELLPFNENDENVDSAKMVDQRNQLRYLLLKAGMRVLHLKKFIRYKYELDSNIGVEFFYKHETLKDDYTIMDLAYIYSWRRHNPIPLYYLIMEPDKTPEDYLGLFSQNKTSFIEQNDRRSSLRQTRIRRMSNHVVNSKKQNKNSSHNRRSSSLVANNTNKNQRKKTEFLDDSSSSTSISSFSSEISSFTSTTTISNDCTKISQSQDSSRTTTSKVISESTIQKTTIISSNETKNESSAARASLTINKSTMDSTNNEKGVKRSSDSGNEGENSVNKKPKTNEIEMMKTTNNTASTELSLIANTIGNNKVESVKDFETKTTCNNPTVIDISDSSEPDVIEFDTKSSFSTNHNIPASILNQTEICLNNILKRAEETVNRMNRLSSLKESDSEKNKTANGVLKNEVDKSFKKPHSLISSLFSKINDSDTENIKSINNDLNMENSISKNLASLIKQTTMMTAPATMTNKNKMNDTNNNPTEANGGHDATNKKKSNGELPKQEDNGASKVNHDKNMVETNSDSASDSSKTQPETPVEHNSNHTNNNISNNNNNNNNNNGLNSSKSQSSNCNTKNNDNSTTGNDANESNKILFNVLLNGKNSIIMPLSKNNHSNDNNNTNNQNSRSSFQDFQRLLYQRINNNGSKPLIPTNNTSPATNKTLPSSNDNNVSSNNNL